MSASLESAVERQKRKDDERRVLRDERLRRYIEQRRSRRQNLRPRLRYTTDADGWRLTFPPSRRKVQGMALWTVVIIAGTAATVHGLGDSALGTKLLIASSIFLGLAYMAHLFLWGQKLPVYFHVAKDGEFEVRGWRSSMLLNRGPRAESSVTINFADDNALAGIRPPGGKFLDDFGDQDLLVLRSFCEMARVPIKVEPFDQIARSADAADANGFEVFGRQQFGKIGAWVTGLTVILMALFFLIPDRRDRSPSLGDTFSNKSLTGSFRSTNKELGEWTLTPSACLSGRERGFEGIAFQFPVGSPVEEIRMDAARQGDNVVEIRLADRKGTVARYRESECQVIEGEIDQSNIDVNGRPMLRLKGHERFSCPAHGLSGTADFDGCLPQ